MWGHLKDEIVVAFKHKVIEEGEWISKGEATMMWDQMVDCIKQATKKVHEELEGKRHSDKKTWRWSVKFQEAIREKRRCYKVSQGTMNTENYEMYKKAKKKVQKVDNDGKFKAYDVFI